MKQFLLKSVLFSFILCSFLTATYFLIKARSETKTTNDPEPNKLYVDEGETLTAAKRNTLVDKKGLKDLSIITCSYLNNSAGSVGWKSKTRTVSDCGGTYKPQDFTNCFSAARLVDGSGVTGLHRCRKNKGDIYLNSSSNTQIYIGCNYLCRNE